MAWGYGSSVVTRDGCDYWRTLTSPPKSSTA